MTLPPDSTFYQPTDGQMYHMYLNYNSEHPPSLKRSIPFSQFVRLKRIHSESLHLLESSNTYVFLLSEERVSTSVDTGSLGTHY